MSIGDKRLNESGQPGIINNFGYVKLVRHYGSIGCDVVGDGTTTTITGSAGSIVIERGRGHRYSVEFHDSDDHGYFKLPDADLRPDLNSQESVDNLLAGYVDYRVLNDPRPDAFEFIEDHKKDRCNASYVTNAFADGNLVIGFHVDGGKKVVYSTEFTYIVEDDTNTKKRNGFILIKDENDETFGFVRSDDGDVVPVTVGLANEVLANVGNHKFSFDNYVKSNNIKSSDERFAGWIEKNSVMYDRAKRVVNCFDGSVLKDNDEFVEEYLSDVGYGKIKFRDGLCLDNDNILKVLESASMIMGHDLKVQQRWSGGNYSHDDIRITHIGTKTPGVIFYGNVHSDLDGLNFDNYHMEDPQLMKFLGAVKSEFDRMYEDGLIEVVDKGEGISKNTESFGCTA